MDGTDSVETSRPGSSVLAPGIAHFSIEAFARKFAAG